MGNVVTSSIVDVPHTVPVVAGGPVIKNEHETTVLRNASHPGELVSDMVIPCMKTFYEVFCRGLETSRNDPWLGSRVKNEDGTFGDYYEYMTYAEGLETAKHVGASIYKRGLVKPVIKLDEKYPQARNLRCIGICSRNRAEWFLYDLMNSLFGFTSVPLYETLGEEALIYMLNQCELSCVAGSESNLLSLATLLKSNAPGGDGSSTATQSPLIESPSKDDSQAESAPKNGATYVRSFICFDEPSEELADLCKQLNIETFTWQSLRAEGEAAGEPLCHPGKSEDVFTICYTSGTTGTPKGVIITHSAFAAQAAGALRGPLNGSRCDIYTSDIYMSYLPLAHVFERAMCLIVTASGGRIAIYSGDTRTLLDDVKIAKPTCFASVPRLYMRIADRIESNLAQSNAVVRYLFNIGIDTKIAALRENGTVHHRMWDALVFRKIKAIMGGNLRFMFSGGAALETGIQERMACLFCCPFLEGYGMTETLGASFLRRGDDVLYGHIGTPLPCNEFKLVSLPEMNYSVNGKLPAGEEFCAGELYIRGNTVFKGYYANPEATAEVLDEDGWLATGDVAVRLPQGGRIKIIDRKKNIFKLPQGEYVAPEKIENIYCQVPLVAQLFVYGDSSRLGLVGLVVLDEDELRNWSSQPDRAVSFSALIDQGGEKLVAFVKSEMERIEKLHKLHGFEKVSNIELLREAFTPENGTLTPTFKLKRNVIRARYRQTIDALYG